MKTLSLVTLSELEHIKTNAEQIIEHGNAATYGPAKDILRATRRLEDLIETEKSKSREEGRRMAVFELDQESYMD